MYIKDIINLIMRATRYINSSSTRVLTTTDSCPHDSCLCGKSCGNDREIAFSLKCAHTNYISIINYFFSTINILVNCFVRVMYILILRHTSPLSRDKVRKHSIKGN